MLCPPPLPPSRLAATEDPKGGGKEGKAGIMSEKSDRPQNKPDMLMGPGKKSRYCVFLFLRKKSRLLPAMLAFWPPLFVPFAGSILPGWRFLLLCSLSFSFSLSHCSERRGVFFRENTARESVGLLSPFRASCRRGEKRRRRRKTDELVLWLADDV